MAGGRVWHAMPSARATKTRRGLGCMTSGGCSRKLMRDYSPFFASGLLCALSIFALSHYGYVFPTHGTVDMWTPVMEAYPDGGMDCYLSIVGRAEEVSDILDGSPYVADAAGHIQSKRLADKLAIDIVLGEAAMSLPPECDGIGGGKAP